MLPEPAGHSPKPRLGIPAAAVVRHHAVKPAGALQQPGQRRLHHPGDPGQAGRTRLAKMLRDRPQHRRAHHEIAHPARKQHDNVGRDIVSGGSSNHSGTVPGLGSKRQRQPTVHRGRSAMPARSTATMPASTAVTTISPATLRMPPRGCRRPARLQGRPEGNQAAHPTNSHPGNHQQQLLKHHQIPQP